MKSELKKNILAACCTVALAGIPLAFADSFTANLTSVTPGQTLELTFQANQALSQDVYLATMLNGALLFVNEQGNVVPYQAGTATPPRLKAPGAGSHKLLSFTMPDGFFQNLTLYQVAGKPGSDLLAGGNYDPATLRTLNVSFTAKPAGATGRTLYADNCASCHGANPTANLSGIRKGSDAQAITTAIQRDKGGMGYLSTLSSSELTAIAQWIANPI